MSDRLHRLLTTAIALLQRAGLWWGLALSAAAAVISFAAVVIIVISWQPDRFKAEEDGILVVRRRPLVLHVLVVAAKNLAGLVMVALGLIMAVPGVPGQGLLTAVIGLSLLSFPGKRRLERRLIRRPLLLRAVNRLRARFHRPPLEAD